MNNARRSRVTSVAVGSAILVTLGSVGAFAAGQIGSRDIRDDSILSRDIHNGTIRLADIRDSAEEHLRGQQGPQGEQGPQGPAGPPGPGSEGPQSDWEPRPGSTIVDENTVKLDLTKDSVTQTSVEIPDLELLTEVGPATNTIEYTYTLAEGAECSAGSLRVFVFIQDTNYNTESTCGTKNENGSYTVKYTIPSNTWGAPVDYAGVVYDAGTGVATVSNLQIAGRDIAFK